MRNILSNMAKTHPAMIEPISETELAAIVRASFGEDTQITDCSSMDGGLFNTSYRIKIVDPDLDTVLRIAPSDADRMLEYERTMMLAEPCIYELIRDADVPTPRTLAIDGSRSIIPRDYIFFEYISAVPMSDPSVPADVRPDLEREFGECLARIHQVKGSCFGWPTPDGNVRGCESWLEVFGGMLEEVSTRCAEADVISEGESADIGRSFDRRCNVFDACSEPRLTHNDIWDPNILVRQETEGWRIAAIIDADRAMFADREFESALWWNNNPAFAEGYGIPLDPSLEAVLRRKFYALYVNLWQAFAFRVQIWQPDWCEHFRQAAAGLIKGIVKSDA